MNVNNTIEKGQQLWPINKYMVDTNQALDIIADSLIDQSTSLCFVGLYLLPTTFLHKPLYTTSSSSFLCSWLLSTATYGCNRLHSLLLLDAQYKTALFFFWPCSLLVLMEIILVASSLKFPVEPCLSWGGGNKYWHGD
jgi:hypothetical protein